MTKEKLDKLIKNWTEIINSEFENIEQGNTSMCATGEYYLTFACDANSPVTALNFLGMGILDYIQSIKGFTDIDKSFYRKLVKQEGQIAKYILNQFFKNKYTLYWRWPIEIEESNHMFEPTFMARARLIVSNKEKKNDNL